MRRNTLEDFKRKISKGGPDECWSIDTCKDTAGYGIFSLCGAKLSTHRLAFELAHGLIPEGMQVDHICHNRWCVNPGHLRLATPAENARNRGVGSANRSGVKGVYWASDRKKWRAEVMVDGKAVIVGRFNSIEEAKDARSTVIARLHGEFACNGEV